MTCVPDDDGDADGSAGDSHSGLAAAAAPTTCTTVAPAVTPAMPRLVLHCLALISHEPSARGTLRSGDGPSSRGSSSPFWIAPPAKWPPSAASAGATARWARLVITEGAKIGHTGSPAGAGLGAASWWLYPLR